MSDQVETQKTYKLKKPFKVGDKVVEQVVLTEPPASKLRGIKIVLPAKKDIETIELDIDTALNIVEVCCAELSPPEITKMSVVDVNSIYWECISLFFG